MNNSRAFTIKFDTLADSLYLECGVSEAISAEELQKGKEHPKVLKYKALWDTGATKSSISQRVVNDLGLIPVGQGINHTAAGVVPTKMYLINILLPCGVGFPSLMVTSSDLGNLDVLIGMDVICKGDFSITNLNGKTTFSFRAPSLETIDYIENTPSSKPIVVPKKVGRNNLCPCGSGKKYKHCCGK